MTANTIMDKSRLAAFVDGELSPEDAAAVVLHLADHPQDQAYVDDLMAANEALSQAFAEPLEEPVPHAIKDTILGRVRSTQVVPFPKRPAAWMGLAVAATLVIAVVVGSDLLAPNGDSTLAVGPVSDGSALATALTRLPSGISEPAGSDEDLMILATLPVAGGHCREFEVVDRADQRIDLGIACNSSGEWVIEVTVSEPLSAAGTEDGFVAASGTEMQGLLPFLDRLGAGDALSPDHEADLISRGWTP